MSNPASGSQKGTGVSRSLALAVALVSVALAVGGAVLIWNAGNRPDTKTAVIEWVDPIRVQSSVVERTIVDTDRLLRLFVVQGRANDGSAFQTRRSEAGRAVEDLTTMARGATPEVRSAAENLAGSAGKWLEFADDWFAAARDATEDSGRVAVMMRMGPEDPLAEMTRERKALDDALVTARAQLLDPEASDDSSGKLVVAGFVLVVLAAVLSIWLAFVAGGRAKSAEGVVDTGLVRAVLDLIPDGVAIFGESGNVIVANLTASRAIEQSDDGRARIALYDSEGNALPDTDAPLTRALGGHHVHDQNVYASKLDGSLSPVDVHAEPVIAEGMAGAVVMRIRDQSEERHVEEELKMVVARADHAEANLAELARRLRTSEAQLDEATANLEKAEQNVETWPDRFARIFGRIGPVGAALFSADDLQLIDVNEAGLEMLGERRRAHDVRGSTLIEIIPGAESSGLLEVFRRAISTGEPYSNREYHAEGLRHGAAYWRFAVIPASTRPGGPIDHALMLGVDTTEDVAARVSAADASERAGWPVEDVLVAIANDLRTPIQSIKGMVELFRAKYAEAVPDVTALHYLELTQRNADQIATLIDDLMELSSLRYNEEDASEIPLAAAIEEAWRSSPRTGIELRVAGPLPTVRADRPKLLRALRDVFDVAARYRKDGEGAWMHVKVRDLDTHWEIDLTDNGKGFHAHEVEALFGPLARNVAHASGNGGLTLVANGMGLAAVRRIAEIHGGSASVRSTPGEGASYTFTIAR